MKCLKCAKEALGGSNYCQDHMAKTGSILAEIDLGGGIDVYTTFPCDTNEIPCNEEKPDGGFKAGKGSKGGGGSKGGILK